jgi:diguanylate cyclase (GGDEF)-like protein
VTKLRKGTAIFAVILAFASMLAAQELSVPDAPRYVFQRLGEDVGLSTLTVTSLAQDLKGFMWIGTQSGLIRYDGHRARKYSIQDGLASTIIDQVIVGPNNQLVVGTRKGVSVYSKDRFVMLARVPDATVDPAYQFVAVDKSGNIYHGTTKGLFRYSAQNTGQFSRIQIDGEKETPIDAVYASPDGHVWFASGRRLGILRAGEPAHWLTLKNELPQEQVIALIEDGTGTLWVRTPKMLSHLDASQQTLIPEPMKIPAANDYGVPTVDRSGNLLVPTVAGVYRHANGRWESIDRTRGMPVNAVYSVTEDQEGAYWLGLAGAGVVRWQGTNSWKGWTEAEGLPDNVIWAITRDEQKRLWVGTNNGVAMWDAGRHAWRRWNADNGLNGSVVRSIATTSDGAIWVQSYPGGLTRFDGKTLAPVRVKTPSPEPSGMVRGLDGRLWIGSKSYLKVLKSNRAPYEFEDILIPKEVQGLTAHLQIKHGVVWCGGANGIARFDGSRWQEYSAKDGLKDDIVTDLAVVSEDEVWFHYNEAFGLWRLKTSGGKVELRHFGTQDGLPADEVYLVGADQKGDVWAGGPLGLTLFPRKGTVQRFTREDGLIWDDLDAEAYFADEDGSIYFGTSGGLARFKPEAVKTQAVSKPAVVITSAMLGNKEHSQESYVRVPYKENVLQVQFAALTFRDIDRVRCYYQLNALENEVSETTLRETRYPALPAGDYNFEVFCKSATGVVSSPASFSFTIARPWWARWETRLIALAMVLLGVAGFVKFRLSHLERERLRLEVAVAQRNTELARTNQELKEASLTDPLTGTRNRRFFDLIIPSDVNQAVRTYSPPLSLNGGRNRDLVLYLIDIDHFKEINDDLGHSAGDRMLVDISARISSVMRQTDVLIRWGGEEFLLVSRSAERSEAAQLAVRVLHAVGGEGYDLPGVAQPVWRTCSVGWAPFPWFEDRPDLVEYETILKMADRALYRAKSLGRNRAFGIVPIGTAAETPNVAFENLIFEWTELQGPPKAEDSARTES